METAGPGDVLDDGRGPERAPVRWHPRHLGSRGTRLLGGSIAVAVLAAVTALSVSTSGHAVRAPAPGAAGVGPAGDVQLLLDQYSYTVQPEGFSLELSMVNYGARPVDILRARLPQAGARPLSGPGGDLPFASPITLVPHVSARIAVPVRVTCPGVLVAPLADHLDVTLGHGNDPVATIRLPLAPLGNLVDDARHAACGVPSASGAVYPTYLAGSVRATHNHTSPAGPADPAGPPAIAAVLEVRNVSGQAVSVRVVGADPDAVRVGPLDRAVAVPAGATVRIPLTWLVLDCTGAAAVRWPSLKLAVTEPTSTAVDTYGFDASFGEQWRHALTLSCPALSGSGG